MVPYGITPIRVDCYTTGLYGRSTRRVLRLVNHHTTILVNHRTTICRKLGQVNNLVTVQLMTFDFIMIITDTF